MVVFTGGAGAYTSHPRCVGSRYWNHRGIGYPLRHAGWVNGAGA